jgi:PAS domain S-box-containing protein
MRENLHIKNGNINMRASSLLTETDPKSIRQLIEIAENMLDITCKVDLSGKIEYISPSCETVAGFKPLMLIGKPILDFIHPEDRERVSRAVEKGIREKTQIRIEFRHRCVDGRYRWVESIGNLIKNEKGRNSGIVYGTRDINDRKRIEQELQNSEERLKILFEAAPDAYYLTDLEGNFIDGNRSAERMIGYGKAELIGANYFNLNLLPPDQRNKAQDSLKRLRDGLPSEPREFVLNRKNNRQLHVEIRSYPVTIGGRKVVLGIARDITRRKKAENSLKKAHAQLEQKIQQRTKSLEEANTALRVLLKENSKDKKALEEKMQFNVSQLILPYIEELKNSSVTDRQKTLIEIIKSNLQDILASQIGGGPAIHIRLTPTEIKVANLVRQGRTTKEIAEISGLSPRTIDGHRNNIRKKLGIRQKEVNLRTYLLSTASEDNSPAMLRFQ